MPNVTPDPKTGIGRWSRSDLETYFRTGLAPDGDSAGGLMAEVIDGCLRHLRPEDLRAIAEYVLSLPPVENQVHKPKAQKKKGEFD